MRYNHRVTGRIIRSLRKERHMSQEILSGLAGIARSHLAMIERGDKSANVETLWRIAEALGMPLSALIARVEEEITREMV